MILDCRLPGVPHETWEYGQVVNLSLLGALVEVGEFQSHNVGDRLTVRFGRVTGEVEVRHRSVSQNRGNLYGVKFDCNREFQAGVSEVLHQMREDQFALAEAWRLVD